MTLRWTLRYEIESCWAKRDSVGSGSGDDASETRSIIMRAGVLENEVHPKPSGDVSHED